MSHAPKLPAPRSQPTPASPRQEDASPLEPSLASPGIQPPSTPLLERVPTGSNVREAAARGSRTPSTSLPFAERIQEAFGRHDIGHIRAHQGRDAAHSAHRMEASAYATGHHVVFAEKPDLWTAAHEAAHVIQQQHGISLPGGADQEGDVHERHAEAVAQRVIARQSAESLLDRIPASPPAPSTTAAPMVQRARTKTSDSLEDIQKDMGNLRRLHFSQLNRRQDQVARHLDRLGPDDHRRAIVERWYHRLQAERHRRFNARGALYTRILRPNQAGGRTPSTNTVYRRGSSLRKRMNLPLAPEGANTGDTSGLYSFMRSYGGAGLQGAHRSTPQRSRIMHQVISKMARDPKRPANTGFSVVSIDPSRLAQDNVLDLRDPKVRNPFAQSYGDRPKPEGAKRKPQNFMGMYDQHASEGVVALKGDIPLEAIEAMVHTGGSLTKEQAAELEKRLLNSTFHSEHEEYHDNLPRKDDRDPSGGGGSRGIRV